MSGKGGIEESLLPIGIGIAGSIAAPALAPLLLGEGVGAAGVALTGAGLGAAGSAVTGRDPLMGALTGGIGGFTAGGGFSDMFGGAVTPEALDYASEAYAPVSYQGVGATAPNIAPTQPVLADYYTPTVAPITTPTDLTQGGVDLSDLDFMPRPGPNVAGTSRYMGVDEVGQMGGPAGGGLRLPSADTTATASADLMGSGLRMPPVGTEATGAVDTASAQARQAMAAAPGKGIAGAGKEPSWWSGLSNMQKAGIIGAGGLGAYTLLKKDNERYGAPGTEEYTGPLSKFSYDPSRFTPTYATPNVYRPRYAEGGTVEQMSRNNAIGANLNFPQSNVGNTLRFSNPINTPMPDNVLGNMGAGVDPYTGAQRFAAGGLASTKAFAVGGTTGVYDPRTLDYVTPMVDPNNPASTAPGGMQQQNIVDVLAAQRAQNDALALQYGNDGDGGETGGPDGGTDAGDSSGGNNDGGPGAGSDAGGNLAKGGIAAAAPSHMQAIDDYMAGAGKEGGMQALMAKAKAGDYNAMIALNKLRKTPNENYAGGGHLGGYSDGGRMLKGPGDGMSDDIPASIGGKQPARLADNEFVVPADVVSHLGNGSSDAGAKKLYAMMDKVRKARTGKKKQAPAIKADKYMPA
jgi:hypothetical protein